MFVKLAALALPVVVLAGCGSQSRDQIKIVGSSTVYPFTTAVAEQFVNKHSNLKAPVVESTGTGAGMKLFCAGIGPQHPDILNASRRIKRSEYEKCEANGVGDVLEVVIGTDGIALAESNNGPRFKLTREQLYLALAANPRGQKNVSKKWTDIDPALPAIPIQVYGPPSTSGTRDAFAELVLNPGCETAMPAAKAFKSSDPDRYADVCTKMRDDGAYVDKGENDNLIVQNLVANPNAVGIFGYSYLEENHDRLHGVPLEGVEPTYETISAGSYPGARPLYLYVKKAHLKAVPGLKEFLDDYQAAWNPSGPLVKRGLIAATNEVRQHSQDVIEKGTPLDPASLR
jgi:phosphate transport system substrate-binding protein